jgi:ABC-type sugar transport system substrate-binding protein
MKKVRLLLATVAAATALAVFPAPAHASHHCVTPDPDNGGLGHTLWVVCEYGPHEPVGVAHYVLCWLSPTC